MLQQMITVIRGMNDNQKLGKLNGTLAARLVELHGREGAARIYRAMADEIEAPEGDKAAREAHSRADNIAQRVLGDFEPYPGESLESYQERSRRAREAFCERYPEWKPEVYNR